jgi:hypothetical protein
MPNTPGGLPYPDATDPVAEGAANIQALAQAVDGLFFIGEVVVAADTQAFNLGAIPGNHDDLIVEIALIPVGAQWPTVGQVWFEVWPTAGNYKGEASGMNPVGDGGYQGSVKLPLGEIAWHSVLGGFCWWAKILIPGYARAERHVIFYDVLGQRDYSGNMGAELVHANGAAYTPDLPVAFQPVTAVAVTIDTAYVGAGSRLRVYGAGKLGPPPATVELLPAPERPEAAPLPSEPPEAAPR